MIQFLGLEAKTFRGFVYNEMRYVVQCFSYHIVLQIQIFSRYSAGLSCVVMAIHCITSRRPLLDSGTFAVLTCCDILSNFRSFKQLFQSHIYLFEFCTSLGTIICKQYSLYTVALHFSLKALSNNNTVKSIFFTWKLGWNMCRNILNHRPYSFGLLR